MRDGLRAEEGAGIEPGTVSGKDAQEKKFHAEEKNFLAYEIRKT